VLVEAKEGEETITVVLEKGKIEETRKGIPVVTQRRWDVYPDVSKGQVKFDDP
jgi:omega-amidase